MSPVEEGHIVKHDGKFATRSYEAPYIKEKIPTKAGDLLKRLRSEPVYGGSSPLQRAAKLFADEATELDEMVTRAEEIQAAQGLFTGHVIVNDENGHAKDDIDFGLSATHNLTLTGNGPVDRCRVQKERLPRPAPRLPQDPHQGFRLSAHRHHPRFRRGGIRPW